MSEMERKVLYKMMDPREMQKIVDMGLRAPAFEDLTCRGAFDWMKDYWESNAMSLAPSHVVMEYEFPALDLIKADDVSTEWLVGAMQQRYLTNQAQEAMREAAKTLNADPEATVSHLWQALYDLSESVTPRLSRSDMSNIAEREARYQARGAAVVGGIPIGLARGNSVPDAVPTLDDRIRGILPGELAAVAAYTKVGKSFLLCKTITSAHMAGYNPILFTLEMSVKEMEDRIDAFYSGVPYSGLSEGSMMPQHERELREARERILGIGPLRIERPARGERTVKHMVNRARQVGADIILIDQLSFIDSPRAYASDNSGMRMKHGDIVFELKDEIARESAGALACMLAVQLNRDVMRDRGNGGRGGLHNFANSSFIEQTVDHAFGLWRNDDMRSSNLMGLDIMGSRRSDKMSWILNWRLHDRTEVSIQREYEE